MAGSAPPVAAASAIFGGLGATGSVLLALAAVIVLGQALAAPLRRLGQPPVIGEILAGILLGPSLLGPQVSAWVLPETAAPYLGVIAQLGVVVFMFLVGLRFDPRHGRYRPPVVGLIATAGILAPFVLGLALGPSLYTSYAGPRANPLAFTLFLGLSLSITAFPVLARILADRGLTHSDLGRLALSCAAIDDVAAWCLLALVAGLAEARPGAALPVVVGTLLYLAVMALAVRPALAQLVRRWEGGSMPAAALPLLMAGALLSALATEWIGIHALFGAFLFGVVVPAESRLARSFVDRSEGLVTWLLLPAFFAYTGLQTRLDLLSQSAAWLTCLGLIAAATFGKLGGTYAAARVAGLTRHDALALGALMNTRGLVELIALNVGLQLGLISPTLFAMLVLMALATTLATAPILGRLGLGVAAPVVGAA
jgi:Kef-type K+ transport system membrane component KefB